MHARNGKNIGGSVGEALLLLIQGTHKKAGAVAHRHGAVGEGSTHGLGHEAECGQRAGGDLSAGHEADGRGLRLLAVPLREASRK